MTFAEPQTAAEIRARYRAARKALWTPRKVAVAPDPPPKTIDRQMAEALDAITVAAAPSVYRAEPAERFAITTILMACAIAGNVTMDEIRSERRQKRIIPARHVFCYLARNHTTLSFPQIGRVIGGRDHCTVIHAASKVAAWLEDGNARYAALVTSALSILRGAK